MLNAEKHNVPTRGHTDTGPGNEANPSMIHHYGASVPLEHKALEQERTSTKHNFLTSPTVITGGFFIIFYGCCRSCQTTIKRWKKSHLHTRWRKSRP